MAVRLRTVDFLPNMSIAPHAPALLSLLVIVHMLSPSPASLFHDADVVSAQTTAPAPAVYRSRDDHENDAAAERAQVQYRVAAASATAAPLAAAAMSQHAVYVGGDGVRLANTSAAPVRGPRDALFAPFTDLARHLSNEARG